jgi:flagellar biosynthesis protein FlhB
LENKTEQPTAKKLQKARARGQIAVSRELSFALILLIFALFLRFFGKPLFENFRQTAINQIAGAAARGRGVLTQAATFDSLGLALELFTFALLPIFTVILLAAFAANFAQTGAVWAIDAIKPDWQRINPAANFYAQIFSRTNLFNSLKSLLKIGFAGFAAAFALLGTINDLLKTIRLNPAASFALMFEMFWQFLFASAIALLILGCADYFWQRFELRRRLRMTRGEVAAEQSETEIKPQVKSLQKQTRRRISSENLFENVRRATVVVCDANEIAVALRYDKKSLAAPVVVAKGAGEVARQIRRIARQTDVPTTNENAQLARKLFAVEISDEIPAELYEVVAFVINSLPDESEEKK